MLKNIEAIFSLRCIFLWIDLVAGWVIAASALWVRTPGIESSFLGYVRLEEMSVSTK